MLIAVLFANYGPYHLARINNFYEFCSRAAYKVVGVELARNEIEYPWKTQIKNSSCPIISTVEDTQLEKVRFSQLIQRLFAILQQINPDILVISGYARPAMLSVLLWSLWQRKPVILLSDSKEDDAPRSRWREIFKSWILKSYKAALVGGQPHKRYLTELGMTPDAIFMGYDVVGNETFHPNKIKSLPSPLNRPYFLAISRFIPKKNLLFLLSSYAAYHQIAKSSAWNLVLCGEGTLRSQLEEYIDELGLQDSVHLPGFLQQNELLPYFAHARCFIHASIQEQWGLVVNEAMAAGLPVLVSNRCGCFEDLVIEGVNGFGFDPENSQQLTDLMLKASSGEVNLQAMGQAAFMHVQKFSPGYFSQGLMQAIEYAVTHRY